MNLFRKSFNNLFLLITCCVLGVALFSAFRGPDVIECKATAEPKSANIIFQSTDGGKTWQDISDGLPALGQPLIDFFAGKSDLYVRFKNDMYHSKSNLKTPLWEKENVLDPRCTSVAFNRTGVLAYNYQAQIFQKTPALGAWSPIYANFKKPSLLTIFEASDGTVFLGSDEGLYRSLDKGRSWKQVASGVWVRDLVESNGVLIGTSQGGIIRSTDHGEHWETVINEGGVGIAVESIDGGFAAISYSEKTLSRRIFISTDSGRTWKAIDDGLRPSLSMSSIKQIDGHFICGHPDGIFRSSDMGKTWKRVHSTVDPTVKMTDGRVFEIYVSGGVVYAVAKDSGC